MAGEFCALYGPEAADRDLGAVMGRADSGDRGARGRPELMEAAYSEIHRDD